MENSVISLNGLVKRYKELTAVDGLNLEVHQGEIFGLLGPNGSGKTTTINCILGLLKFNGGTIRIFGEEMTPANYALRRRIGIVPQNVAVTDELTVQENINFFCGLYVKDKTERHKLLEEAIRFAGLEQFRKFRPKKLSGGLLRRLNIACGIVHKPELIFLDEPTVAVDPQSRSHILEGIKELRDGGATIIYTTHYMEEVEQICDRVAVIDRGKNIALGTVDELKNLAKYTETIRIDLPKGLVGSMRRHNDSRQALVRDIPDHGAENTVDSPALKALLADLRYLPHVASMDLEESSLSILCSGGSGNLMRILRVFETHNIPFLNVTTKMPTLNDVFLDITGRQLRD